MSPAEATPQAKEWRGTRRDLLKWVGWFTLSGGFSGAASATALYTPEKSAIPREAGQEVFPGWIEANIKSKFIQPDKGHFYWLREAVFANPLLLGSTRAYVAYLNQNLQEGRRLSLGEMLTQAITKTGQRLNAVDVSNFDPQTNPSLEAVHAGLFTFAAALNTWFSPDNLRKFGVLMKDSPGAVADYYWGKSGLGTNVFPQLFGIKNEEKNDGLKEAPRPPRFVGQDRTVHFAQHLLITFAYLYSRHYDLPEHKSIPLLLKAGVFLGGNSSTESEAVIFSEITGRLYEYSALTHLESWFIPGIQEREKIEDGPFDPMVKADYKANRLGAQAAVALWRQALNGKPLDPVLQELDDARFNYFETPPQLNSF